MNTLIQLEKPQLAIEFLLIFEKNLETFLREDYRSIFYRKYINDETLLTNLFEWHFEAWETYEKYVHSQGYEFDSLKSEYLYLEKKIADLIDKIMILSLQNDYHWHIFIKYLQVHLVSKKDKFVEIKKQYGEPDKYIYLNNFNIYETFFENAYKTNFSYSLKNDNSYFFKDWKTTPNIDFENKKWTNIYAHIWFDRFRVWFFNASQDQSNPYSSDAEFFNKANFVASVLFPEIFANWWSWVLWYYANFSWQEANRIKDMISKPKQLIYEGNELPLATSLSDFKSEEVYKTRFENTINLSVDLFKNTWDKNLNPDLAEIAQLKKEFDNKKDLTDEEKKQKYRLEIIEQIWLDIEKEVEKSKN